MDKTCQAKKTYDSLILLPTFSERFEYLRLPNSVGTETFGADRIFNQMFYRSKEWKTVRDAVIVRDNGNDLAFDGRSAGIRPVVHHINPIRMSDIESGSLILLDMNNLICVSEETHRAIHYGILEDYGKDLQERSANDTCPWRKA